tara:strand:- start:1774 stop:2814 length:1041 start_codon:yes stop_codon:yes gene_type:complete
MRILDFATSRRAYLMSLACQDRHDYKFYLYSNRKEFFKESERDARDIDKYCPECFDDNLQRDKIDEHLGDDIVMMTAISLWLKEFDPELIKFLDNMKGKFVAVDYAWDAAKRKLKRKMEQTKKDFDAVSVAIGKCLTPIHPIFFSQPELDMYAHAHRFVSKEDVIKRYGLGEADKYVLITSATQYEMADHLMEYLKGLKGDVFIIWKIKEKQDECVKRVEDIFKRHDYKSAKIIVKQPDRPLDMPGKSHTDFISPVCELSVVVDSHIGLPPLSFSHMEMVRAGVPTYRFDDGFSMPKEVFPVAEKVWSEASVKRWKEGYWSDRDQVEVVVDDLFFTNNLVEGLEKL